LGVEFELATTDDAGPGKRLPASEVASRHAEGSGCGGDAQSRYHVFAKQTEFYKVSLGLAQWLDRHVQEYDVLHLHALFSFSTIAAGRAAKRAGVPYIVRPLGTLTRYGIEQRRPWLKRASLQLFDGPVIQHAAAVHFTAESELDEAKMLGIPMRAVVVPLAVEPETKPDLAGLLTRFPVLDGTRYALFLSRLDPKKNVEGLLDAFASVDSNVGTLRLVVAGDGDAEYVRSLKKLATERSLGERVLWAGFLSGGVKSAAIQHAEIFVLPSFSENFGIAAAEALLAGVPCVLGRGVAIAEKVQQAGAGLAVDPKADQIAAAMMAFLNDPARRQHAALAARRFAQQELSMEVMGQRLLALYRNVSSTSNRGALQHD
jgi:glycosyltransferase involved in cell wall biosynthesis